MKRFLYNLLISASYLYEFAIYESLMDFIEWYMGERLQFSEDEIEEQRVGKEIRFAGYSEVWTSKTIYYKNLINL